MKIVPAGNTALAIAGLDIEIINISPESASVLADFSNLAFGPNFDDIFPISSGPGGTSSNALLSPMLYR